MPTLTSFKKPTSRHAKWSHSKFKARTYSGSYEEVALKKSKSKERIFVLTSLLKNGKLHSVSFDSHEAAKKSGWVRA